MISGFQELTSELEWPRQIASHLYPSPISSPPLSTPSLKEPLKAPYFPKAICCSPQITLTSPSSRPLPTQSKLFCLVAFVSYTSWASQVVWMVKNPPAMQETEVPSLGWEDPLEKGRATHSSILAWRIPWTEEPFGLQLMGSPRVRPDWATNIFTFSPS